MARACASWTNAPSESRPATVATAARLFVANRWCRLAGPPVATEATAAA